MLSKNKNIWGGIYVATICPMDENGGFNEDVSSNNFTSPEDAFGPADGGRDDVPF